jgi:hypothetical protein
MVGDLVAGLGQMRVAASDARQAVATSHGPAPSRSGCARNSPHHDASTPVEVAGHAAGNRNRTSSEEPCRSRASPRVALRRELDRRGRVTPRARAGAVGRAARRRAPCRARAWCGRR